MKGKLFLYVVTIELDEDSVYFTEMTEREAREMEGALKDCGHPYTLEKVIDSPGFNDFDGLMDTIDDLSDRRRDG